MDDAILTRAYLRESSARGFDLTHARWLSEALDQLEQGQFDIVLLDLNLPDSEKLETVTRVLEAGPDLPVLILSGYDDEGTAVEAVRAGAQDYMLKNDLSARLLRRAMSHAIERKRSEMALARLALYDELTGLPNRTLLLDRWLSASARARRNNSQTGILVIDLDSFKQINDGNGHLAGDRCLKIAADRMSAAVRGNDTVARFGGDEFVVLLEEIQGVEDTQRIADKIDQTLADPIDLEGQSLSLGASIGKAISKPDEEEGIEAVISRADAEMYSSKCARKTPPNLRKMPAAAHC